MAEAYWVGHAGGLEIAQGLFAEDELACAFLGLETKLSLERAAKEKLARLALRDELTGLYNRHIIEPTYEGLQTPSRRRVGEQASKSRVHSALIIDADRFGRVNELYGHIGGDTALKNIAAVITASTRKRDVAVRWGGEEFLVILPRSTEGDATRVAERIRRHVEKECVTTVSVGVGQLDLEATLEENLVRVDSALYQAKETRNQVVRVSELAVPA